MIDCVPDLLGASCVLQENHWKTLKSLQACVEGDQVKDGMWLLQSTICSSLSHNIEQS